MLYRCSHRVVNQLHCSDLAAPPPPADTWLCGHMQVTPSPTPNTWRLRDIFIVGAVYGLYLTLSTWVLYHVRNHDTGFYTPAATLHACQLVCHWSHQLYKGMPSQLVQRYALDHLCCNAGLPHVVLQVAAKTTFFERRIHMFSHSMT